MFIKIKPLSVNKAWQGRRFKTKMYKNYEKELMLKLKPILINPKDKLRLYVTFYFKNPMSDIDNGLKPFIDILQKKYLFNDNRIYELLIKKEIATEEGIDFHIESI